MGLFNRKKKTMSLNEAAESDMINHSIKNLDRVMNNKQIEPRAEIPVVMADAYEDSIEKENKIDDEMNKTHKNVRQFISDYVYKETPDKISVTGAMKKMKLSENLFEDFDTNTRHMIYKQIAPASDDFFDLFEDLIDRAISSDEDDISDCVSQAIDDGLIYNDDIWAVKKHYEDTELSDKAYKQLVRDLYSIVSRLRDNDDIDESIKPKRNNKKLNEDYSDLQQITNLIRYNGAEYRGARIPRAISNCINQANIEDNTRLKDLNVTVVDNNTIKIDYITQESFVDDDAYILAGEIERAITAICDKLDYVEPFNVDIVITARDGKKYGYFNDTVEINNGEYTYYDSEIYESLNEARPTGWRKPIFDDLYDEIYTQLARTPMSARLQKYSGIYADDTADSNIADIQLGTTSRSSEDLHGYDTIRIQYDKNNPMHKPFDFALKLIDHYELTPRYSRDGIYLYVDIPEGAEAVNNPIVLNKQIIDATDVTEE